MEVYKKTEVRIKNINRDGTVITTEGLISEQFSKEKLKNIFKKVDLDVKISELNSISYICEAVKR